jgi:hypothetical protein
MNSLVQKYSKSSTAHDDDVLGVHGKWDASLDLAFPTFDIPGAQNVSLTRPNAMSFFLLFFALHYDKISAN